MSKNRSFSLTSRFASFVHAGRGLKSLMQTEHNARVHAVITCFVFVAGIVLKISALEWCLIILAMTTVWIAETLNTAIECLTDLVSPDYHPLAGRVKDIAAGAVLLSAVGALLVGVVIFVPQILKQI